MVLESVDFFSQLSDKERCIFETGIKLGATFHQFVGTPVSPDSKDSLGKAIEEAIKNQPYVKDAKVKITLSKLNEFGYATLSEEMLDILVTVEYGKVRCVSRMKYIKDYPLMYVEAIEEL